MSAKAKGSHKEHRPIELLEAAGYACTRAAVSPGIFNVIGVGATDIVLVQVKTRDWPCAAEVEQIKSSCSLVSFGVGSDAVEVATDVMKARQRQIDQWRDLSVSTDGNWTIASAR